MDWFVNSCVNVCWGVCVRPQLLRAVRTTVISSERVVIRRGHLCHQQLAVSLHLLLTQISIKGLKGESDTCRRRHCVIDNDLNYDSVNQKYQHLSLVMFLFLSLKEYLLDFKEIFPAKSSEASLQHAQHLKGHSTNTTKIHFPPVKYNWAYEHNCIMSPVQ